MKTLIRTGFAIGLLGTSAIWAIAQAPQPFDMSGERVANPAPAAPPAALNPAAVARPEAPFQLAPPVQPAQPAQPVPVQPAPAAAPQPPAVAPAQPSAAARPEPIREIQIAPVAPEPEAVELPPAPQPAQAAPEPAPAPAPQPAQDVAAATAAKPALPANFERRYIVPSASMRLEGEMDQRAWAIFLTADQAATPARLDVSFKNAIVVMPEASRLRVSINNEPVLETALSSSESFRDVMAMVPPGLLQAGANTIRFQVAQRHRTDCTVQSTFELWTEIDPAGTSLIFARADAPRSLRGLVDLPAIGFNEKGVTPIHVIAPGSNQPTIAPHLLKLVQALALTGNYPNPVVTVSETVTKPDGDGSLTVVLGVASEISAALTHPPADAISRPIVGFVDDERLGTSVLVVSGANWGQIGTAIETMAAAVDRPISVVRTVMNTAPWLSPDVRFVTGKDSFRIADAGAGTQEFSGRRFHTEFAVGVPSDFYAEAYGEATLLLDAAYTSAVRPASHIDIYVNDQIAATTRITRQQGGIYRQFPIQVPLRHFRPGVNRISINAMLDTAEDAVCAPGGSTAGGQRFVLFDTTTFAMPNFARIGRRPNLAAFAGTAFPYNRAEEPSALVLGRADPTIYSAAASLVARMAIQAGRIVPLTPTPAASVGDRSAIFVGTAAQMPASVLGQVHVAESIRTSWRDETSAGKRVMPASAAAGFEALDGALHRPGTEIGQAPASSPETEDTSATFNRWRSEVGGGGLQGQLAGFEGWLQRNFDISFSTFRLREAAAPPYDPAPKTSLIVAQQASPNGGGTWTVLTAPSEERLITGIQSISTVQRWPLLGGALTTYSATTDAIESRPLLTFEFVMTQPVAPGNLRLIAANWLSSNVVVYAIGLVVLCIVLGIVTTGLLARLGRRS
ncbi:cellulose biosynthesis cyclic di-GMP-binding regulatory protein BcsB [Kaistia nematophila]|uniref:Cyclic di-GMP-binding protein n=1 Tax=Kaistia nematophila TaxID=2994654 RepID=A0A9X3E0P7_9HYPH|nr:cellulose biosynthesis cyclic di-GMP-binding regulatory protein BcsB [Kaistia nematophila]MCX5569232.1 cellulose biosynthesis cyclic di-GMP-binding regulatory protein BcsB [Kaistia nematophila]